LSNEAVRLACKRYNLNYKQFPDELKVKTNNGMKDRDNDLFHMLTFGYFKSEKELHDIVSYFLSFHGHVDIENLDVFKITLASDVHLSDDKAKFVYINESLYDYCKRIRVEATNALGTGEILQLDSSVITNYFFY
jgi:hypothetical protein